MIARSGSQAPSKGPAEYFTGSVRVQPMFAEEETAPYSGAYVTFQQVHGPPGISTPSDSG